MTAESKRGETRSYCSVYCVHVFAVLFYKLHIMHHFCSDLFVSSILGYNEFNYFYKMKNIDPLMDAKLKSKTHLQNKLFDFLSRLASKFLKSAI